MRPRLAWLALVVGASGCGASALEQATRSFTTATADGARAMREQLALSSEICRRRGAIDFFAHRLQSDPPWGTPPFWSSWAAERTLPGLAQTWKQHCAHLATSDAVHRDALDVLGGYAAALDSVVAGSHYDGADLKSAAEDGGKLADALIADEATGATVKSFVAGTGEPLAKLASNIMLLVAEHKLSDAVARAAPDIDVLLGGFERYTAVAEQQLSDLRGRAGDVLTQLDGSMKGTHDDAAALRFYEFAQRSDEEQRVLAGRIEAYRAALAALRRAHRALVAEVEKKQ